MKRLRQFFVFVVLTLLLSHWSNTVAFAEKDEGNPKFDPAYVELKMEMVSARLAPKSEAQKIRYEALLNLKNQVMSQQESKFQEKQIQKDVLFQTIAPGYKEYADLLEQGTASLAASGDFSLKNLENISSDDLDFALELSHPTETSMEMGNMDAEVEVLLKDVISHKGLSVSTAIRGDPILVKYTQWWKPSLYGWWQHTLVTLSYGKYIHAPGPNGAKNAYTTWDQSIKGRTVAIMGVWSTSNMRNSAAAFSDAQLNETYNWASAKWNTSLWYCSKLSWAGYYYKSFGVINLDSNGGYWVTPDNIYWSMWTFIRSFSWSA